MKRTFRYKIYPTKEQIVIFELILFLCRKLYNAGLEQRRIAWHSFKKSVSSYDQIMQISDVKNAYPEYTKVYSQVLQDVLRRLDKSFNNFFRPVKNGQKPGYPRFKSQFRFRSFTYPQSGFELKDGKLWLSKIGTVRMFQHRPIEGEIKTLTIKRDNVGDWFATFVTEMPDVPKIKPKNAVGIDVGIEKLATLTNDTKIENPHLLNQSEELLKKKQAQLSKKKKGSNNRNKARIKVAKVHRKIQRQRDDFLHKQSRILVDKHDLIVFENLKIPNMVQNHHLAKSIADCSWGKLMLYAVYKAENAGKYVYFVNPNGTTQICSRCGILVKKSLADRTHQCPTCGLCLERDLNASMNILKRVGGGTAELTPEEIEPLLEIASSVVESGSPTL